MPFVTLQLAAGGPVVDLVVGVSGPRQQALRTANQLVPSPVQIRGLIDTGASCTCIDPSVLEALKLTPRGTVPIHTPSTSGTAHTANQYDVSLIFLLPSLNWRQPALPVIESHLSNQGFQALIGRDILAHELMTYNGPAGLFLLGF